MYGCFWNIYFPFQTLQGSVQGHRVKTLKKAVDTSCELQRHPAVGRALVELVGGADSGAPQDESIAGILHAGPLASQEPAQ